MLENTLVRFHTSKTVSASTEAATGKLDPSGNHVHGILQTKTISKASSCLQHGTAVSPQGVLERLPRKDKSILGMHPQSSTAAHTHTNLDTPLGLLTQWGKKNKAFKKETSHL